MMTCRKSNTMFYRIFAFAAVFAVALLSWLFVFAFGEKAYAEEAGQDAVDYLAYADNTKHDEIFGVNHANATKLTTAADFDALASGTYCVDEDIKINKAMGFYYDEQIKICLHGHSLYLGYNYLFRVYSGADISIYDCGGTGTISSQLGNTVEGMKDNSTDIIEHGVFNLYGGAITGGKNGNAVSVSRYGIFNMYGGVISGNVTTTKSSSAPGVFVAATGTFNMYGGLITGNRTTDSYGGAGVYLYNYDSEFHMYGGTISGNITDCTNASADSKKDYYNGAGVNFKTGIFSIEGNANISGNIKIDGDSQTINNVYVATHNEDGQLVSNIIDISGKLGADAQIGITTAAGNCTFTNGYKSHGNTADPSKYFRHDGGSNGGKKIGYNSTNREAAVLDSDDSGVYVFESAEIVSAAAATVGDAEVSFTIKVTLVNTSDRTKKDYDEVIHKVTLDQRLHGGNNNVSFAFTYDDADPVRLQHVVVPAKLRVKVEWACDGGTLDGAYRTFKRGHDGNDVISFVSAAFTGYDGELKVVNGSTTSSDITATDMEGNPVDSTAETGKYIFHLAPSIDYDYDYDSCTVEVVADMPVDTGYFKVVDVKAGEVVGTPVVGEKRITVKINISLEHTETKEKKSETKNYAVALDTPLNVGENTIKFKYQYTDKESGVQTKELTVKVTVAKKQVTVKWYFNDSLVTDNTLKHIYDGVDVANKIVARFDGVDGTKQNIDGASSSMIKKDANGNAVTSLKDVGVYTLSLADSADYVFGNNLFTYTVAKDLGAISDLTYEKDGIFMGVSSSEGFESGTELKVEKVTGIDSTAVNGDINTAYNIRFVKGVADIAPPAGMLTVYVLVPDGLRNKTYKIYNFVGGVATELRYTSDGNYATFVTGELDCLLFVEVEDAPPIIDPDDPNPPVNPDDPNTPGNKGDNPMSATIDDSGLTWLWVFLAVLGAFAIIGFAVLIAKSKSNKDKKK